MTSNRFFIIFHLVIAAILALTGYQLGRYQILVDDELYNVVTAASIATHGTIYLSDGAAAFLRENSPYYPVRRTFLNGWWYSKHGVANVIPIALLYLISPKLAIYSQMFCLVLILYLLRRMQKDHQLPDTNYYLAALFIIFGSTIAPYWFSYFPYIFAGTMLLIELYYFQRFCRTGTGEFLILAGLGYTALVFSRPEASTYGLLPFVVISWQFRHRLPKPGMVICLLAIAILLAGSYTALLNYCKTGSIADNGEGMIVWQIEGLRGGIIRPDENILIGNLALLLLIIHWRQIWRQRAYIVTAGGIWLLYNSWLWWDTGYYRLTQHAVLLLGTLLLFMPLRKLTIVLVCVGLLFNGAYFFIPYFDVADVYGLEQGPAGCWWAPYAGLRFLIDLTRGWQLGLAWGQA